MSWFLLKAMYRNMVGERDVSTFEVKSRACPTPALRKAIYVSDGHRRGSGGPWSGPRDLSWDGAVDAADTGVSLSIVHGAGVAIMALPRRIAIAGH